MTSVDSFTNKSKCHRVKQFFQNVTISYNSDIPENRAASPTIHYSHGPVVGNGTLFAIGLGQMQYPVFEYMMAYTSTRPWIEIAQPFFNCDDDADYTARFRRKSWTKWSYWLILRLQFDNNILSSWLFLVDINCYIVFGRFIGYLSFSGLLRSYLNVLLLMMRM